MEAKNFIQIEMDFQKAQTQAKELDDIAERLGKIVNTKLPDTLNALGQEWKGENANRYITKGFKLKENMAETVNALHNAATKIRSIAKKMYDTEMENLRIAEERKSV